MKFWNKNLILILAFAFLLRLNFALFTPNWQATDEYPHFFVLKYLAIFENYPKSNLEFPYYEAYQPPLYYQLTSVLYNIFRDFDNPSPEINQPFDPDTLTRPLNLTLFALRLFSVILSIFTLFFIYYISYLFFRNENAIYTLLIASSLPTFVVNNSSVTNDALANLLGTIILFLVIRTFLSEQNKLMIKSVVLGIVLGLSLQTKANLYPFILIILTPIFFSNIKRKVIFRYCLTSLLIAIIISLDYFHTNYKIYGSVIPISPDIEKKYFLEYISLNRIFHAFRNYFWSFWAAAGRIYQIHLEAYQYALLFFPITIISLVGNIKYLLNKDKLKNQTDYGKYFLFFFSAILCFLSAIYFYFLFEKNPAWGRYIYPNLAAYLVLFVFGVNQLINEKYQKFIFILLFSVQVIINIYFLVVLNKIP